MNRRRRPKKSDGEELNSLFIGTKVGACPVCEETRTLLLLRDGMTICRDCLRTCIRILEFSQTGINGDDLIRRLNLEALAHSSS